MDFFRVLRLFIVDWTTKPIDRLRGAGEKFKKEYEFEFWNYRI